MKTAFQLTFIILTFHMISPSYILGNKYFFDSSIEEKNLLIKNLVYAHGSLGNDGASPPFKRRIVINKILTEIVMKGGEYSFYLFVIFHFVFLFFAIYVLGKISIHLGLDRKGAIRSQYIFSFSYPILFLFFTPVYGYGEPLLFALFFCGYLSYLKGNYISTGPAWLLAAFTHESTFLLFPLFTLDLYFKNSFKDFIKKSAASLLIPTFIYAVYYLNQSSHGMEGRWSHYQYNFQSVRVATHSLVCSFMALAIPLLFVRNLSPESKRKFTLNLKVVYLSVIINFILVMLAMKAKEARLLILCVLPLFPVLGEVKVPKPLKGKKEYIITIIIGIIAYLIFNPIDTYWKVYHRAYFSLFCMFLSLYLFGSKRHRH